MNNALDPRQPVDTLRTIPKQFDRSAMKSKTEIPDPSRERNYAFQWMLYKPQQHAIRPFATDEQTRLGNYNSLSQ
jgi:hypothetical protein